MFWGDGASCGVIRKPGREGPGMPTGEGQCAESVHSLPAGNPGPRAPGSLPSSSPAPSRPGHPRPPAVPTETAPPACSSSPGAARWAREGPQCGAQPSPPIHPHASPPRHRQGGTRQAARLIPSSQECLGESAVTQGSSCGPSALAVAGDPHGEEPPRLGP